MILRNLGRGSDNSGTTTTELVVIVDVVVDAAATSAAVATTTMAIVTTNNSVYRVESQFHLVVEDFLLESGFFEFVCRCFLLLFA